MSKLKTGQVKWLLVGLAAASLVCSIVVVIIYTKTFTGDLVADQAIWGQFGDYVGGVLNPALAFLTLIAVLFTIVLQGQELEQSTKELANSAQALKKQHEALVLQNFESTFFQLLRRVGEIADSIRYANLDGRNAIGHLSQRLRDLYHGVPGAPTPSAKARAAYEIFYREQRGEVGHYFRALYHIFMFVHRSALADADKITYANIARAQLSSAELILLFYNCTVGEGEEGFKPLVEEYGLLKHVARADLFDQTHMDAEDLFKRSAFMGREERARLAGR